MVKLLALAAALLCLASPPPAGAVDATLLPTPPSLEPHVRFWTRIYTEIDGQGGLIHDSESMEVVYEVLRFPEGLSRRAREKRVESRKKRIRAILHRLAQGKRENLTSEEAEVLSRWPQGVSNQTLARARSRVRFQLGQADRFRAGVIRAGRWADHVEQVLAQYGVPPELAALPHVESSYNPRAYSRVGAAGLWQFTRSTGRLYLRVDHVVDERMDPYRATDGAARLLRDNYRRLEAWPLAITAYNHGVAGMARAVRKLGTKDMGEIAHRYDGRTFGFASRNFYAEFLAAAAIAADPERYFGFLSPDPPLRYEILETDAYYAADTLERALGIDREHLREHNLALRPSVWNGAKLVPRGYPLRIPVDAVREPFAVAMAGIPADERKARQIRDRFHKVGRGETLSVIARRYDTSQDELVALNNLRSRHRIRAGQVLRLPDDGFVPSAVARLDPPADGVYRVVRGDSLTVIARRFGVSQQDLVAWNDLSNRHQLAVGQSLRVAAPEDEGPTLIAAADSAATDALPVAPVVARAAAEAPALEPAAPVERDPLPLEPAAEASLPAPAEEPPLRIAAAVVAEPPVPAPGAVTAVALPEAPGGPNGPEPSNYAVTRSHRITVQAEETLGHYAEWLEVPTSQLRRLNGMRYGEPLVIGRQKKLDFSRVSPEAFEQRRLAYHRDLQEDFFDHWVVTGTTTYTLGRGQSLWTIAREKFEVPIWLLRQHNPDLDFGNLRAGTPMVIPLLEPRGDS